ncbi:MAG: ECF-type sigma factor [Pseudomonadota bacterium]|nr:ECF-type sigma factor [Pseudomonadota bacterium]
MEHAIQTNALVELCYSRLKHTARRELRRWPGAANPQTTELVHSAYLRLATDHRWSSVEDFMAAAANCVRQVLVDEARARTALKRGGKQAALSLDALGDVGVDEDAELVELDEALSQLDSLEPRLARVVECRFFAGFSNAETAQILGLTERTIRRDWIKARAWLRVVLNESGSAAAADSEALPAGQ